MRGKAKKKKEGKEKKGRKRKGKRDSVDLFPQEKNFCSYANAKNACNYTQKKLQFLRHNVLQTLFQGFVPGRH